MRLKWKGSTTDKVKMEGIQDTADKVPFGPQNWPRLVTPSHSALVQTLKVKPLSKD